MENNETNPTQQSNKDDKQVRHDILGILGTFS